MTGLPDVTRLDAQDLEDLATTDARREHLRSALEAIAAMDHEVVGGPEGTIGLPALHHVYGRYMGRRIAPAQFEEETCPVCRAANALADVDEAEERSPL